MRLGAMTGHCSVLSLLTLGPSHAMGVAEACLGA
jgi:hypothetical protein